MQKKDAEKEFRAGETYLCKLPYHNLVLRQIVVSQPKNALEFIQNNPENGGTQIYSPVEAWPMILGRVTWVAKRW